MPFSTFGLHADLIRGVKDLAFTHPTPIQKEAIGPAVQGRDLLACAATGSGKTAAFMLPTLHRLMTHSPAGQRRAVRALVLTPTRELAAQILDNLNSLAVHTPLSGASIIGGVGMGPQAHAFRTGTEILIATPGRLLDHMRQPYARFDALEILVLDEADRMLDMGFLPDIRRILRALPAKRQTLFFSATMPPEIRQLSLEMLRDPVTIQIERQAAPAGGITQAIYPVPQHLKSDLLKKLLEQQHLDSVIVFTRTKHRANRLAAQLTQGGISCVPIHGNRSQAQRTAALAGFKSGHYRVLVATDIAARGIDIADVSHVINFDCPHIAEDYIHRVGRTGRAAATGDAFTFVADDEQQNLRVIERAINKRLPRVTLPDFDYTRKAAERLEIPIEDRIAAIRAQKAKARARQQQSHSGGHSPHPPRQHGESRGSFHGRSDNRNPQNPPQGGHSGGASLGSMRAPHQGGGKHQKRHRPGSGKFPNRPGGRFGGPAGTR
jgi:ATP-dependent RNA helicase RhlE